MKTLMIALLASAIAAPAIAQDGGHKMAMPSAAAQQKPETGQAPAGDPHAGHDMSKMGSASPKPPADPHAGHTMGTMAPSSPPAGDGSGMGHDMSKMGSASPKPPADPHAGHTMGTMAPSSPATGEGSGMDHDMSKMGSPGPKAPADPHAGHGMAVEADSVSEPPAGPPPPAALSDPKHAADTVFDPSRMEHAREELRAEQGAAQFYRVLIDRLEARLREGQDGYLWDVQGWYGGDIDKVWLKTEGEGAFDEDLDEAETQLLWSRAITPWFDIQSGARYDVLPGSDRGYFVLGFQGLLPYQFDVDAAAFVSNKGDVSGRVEAEYDLLLTQRFILQPRAEINLAVQEAREFGIGSGVTDAELGLRLRYEFAREFAPYIGVNWERKLGKTADFAREDGESVNDLFFVMGLRISF